MTILCGGTVARATTDRHGLFLFFLGFRLIMEPYYIDHHLHACMHSRGGGGANAVRHHCKLHGLDSHYKLLHAGLGQAVGTTAY